MWRRCAVLAATLLLVSCASAHVIPPALEQEVDKEVSFLDLVQAPDRYAGKTVAVSGEVLAAKRTQEGTVMEVLQLPMERWEPIADPTASQGRFLAWKKEEFLDPATLPKHTRVTIVGQITGSTSHGLDDFDYVYPQMTIRYLKVWEDRPAPDGRAGPWFGISIGGGTGGRGVGMGTGVGISF